MRTVSDRADDDSHIDFPLFLRDVASVYSSGILRRFLAALPKLTQAEEAFNTPPA
jgi:adenosylhomocysteine nucleosidase